MEPVTAGLARGAGIDRAATMTVVGLAPSAPRWRSQAQAEPLVAMPVMALLLVPRGIARHDALDGPVDALARSLSRGGIGAVDPSR